MSLIIDFYKGNGGKKGSLVFLRKKKRCWFFRFFRLTIVKWDKDIMEEFGHLLKEEK